MIAKSIAIKEKEALIKSLETLLVKTRSERHKVEDELVNT